MDELELSVEDKKIYFSVITSYWSDVYLMENNKRIRLGGYTFKTIVSKLLRAFILSENKKYYEYSGLKLFTVFTLMDPHGVMAAREINNFGIEFVFIDFDGKVVQLGKLSYEEMGEWVDKLVIFSINYKEKKEN